MRAGIWPAREMQTVISLEANVGSTSFWQAEATEDRTQYSAAEPPQGTYDVDVAIIGAGITGVATALWLARDGARVMLLEARHVAAGASGRNGGFLLGGTAETYAAAIGRYGRVGARRIWAFSVANRQLASEFVAELDAQAWQTGYDHAGSLRIAVSASELEDLTASATLLREDGWKAEVVERGDLPERLRESYSGAIYYPDDGEVQPARFVSGLARLAQQAGVLVFENSPVISLTLDGASATLTLPQGKVRAPAVVLATNAWLSEIGAQLGASWLAACITPTRGQMLATEPVSERIFTCPCYADEGYQYFRQLRDGRLVVGGWRNHSFETEASSDETPGAPVQRHLDAFVHDTLRLPDIRVEHRWAGIMAFTPDELPLVGRLPYTSQCYIAGGYTGHGNAYALKSARIISDLILGRTAAEADLFDPMRFAR